MYTSAPTPQVVDSTPSPSGDESTTTAANDACRLVVDKQPIDVFYKDEGGKANHLLATVHLSEAAANVVFGASSSNAPSTTGTPAAVHVTATLYYESGIRVEDGDEIFTILSFERAALQSGAVKAELRFRVEKVSRRKDGQRFKVRFDVDKDKSPAAAGAILGAFTSCVCVLSKRKFSSSNADGTVKRGRRGSVSIGHSAGGFSYVGGGGSSSSNSVGGRSRKGSMSSVSSAGPATSPSGNNHGNGNSTAGGGGGVVMANPASAVEVQRLAAKFTRLERANDSLSKTVRSQDERIAVLERVLQSTLETQTKLAHQLRQQQQQQQQQLQQQQRQRQQQQSPVVQLQRFSNQQNLQQNLQQYSMHSANTAARANSSSSGSSGMLPRQQQHSLSNSSLSSLVSPGELLFNNNNNVNNNHNHNNNRENAARFLNVDGTSVVVNLGCFDDLDHNTAVSVKAEHLPSSSLSSSPAPMLDDCEDEDEGNRQHQHHQHQHSDALPRPLKPKRQRSLELMFNFGNPCSSPPLDFGDVVVGGAGECEADDVDGDIDHHHLLLQ